MKLLATVVFLIASLFNTFVSTAQSFNKVYTLPPSGTTQQINCISQLKSGYLLVGATSGLFRFDGDAFQKISGDKTVPANVTAIYETADGNIWVGFGDGKLGWLRNNKLTLQAPEEGFPAKPIKKITQDFAGIVWIATAGEGIYYFANGHFYNINTDDGLSDNYVYDIVLSGGLVAAGTDRGINFCSIDKNNKKRVAAYTTADGLTDNIITCLVRGKGNTIFYGTQDAGMGLFTVATNNISPVATGQLQKGTVNSMAIIGNSLWMATQDDGLQVADVDQLPLTLSKQFELKAASILPDSEGNVWAIVNDQLVRTNGNKLRPLIFLSSSEASNLHTLLLDNEKHIWFNVSTGLKHLGRDEKGNWIERIFHLPVSINSQITALYEDRFENIWIGTMGNGAFLLDARSGKFRKITEDKLLSTASILSITGRENEVWIASLEGAVRCNLTGKNGNINEPLQIHEFTAISGIGTNYIYHIFIDSKNRTWFATDGKGLAMYQDGKITNYNQKQGLRSEVVYQVTEDRQGNIWFTTFNAGLVKFDGKQFRYFGIAEGISDMNITSLASDKFGNLYVGHKNGIDIINTTSNSVSYLDDEQGLSNLNTDLNAITTDKDGNVYFLSNNGIYRYAASQVRSSPKVVIDRVQLFLNDIEVADGHVFSSGDNNISFYYTGLAYSQPEKVQYQYKLEGYGNEWITTNDRRRDFPKLAPGTYTFHVRASLNRNFDNAEEATFTFTIQKPLWMRWWFIALCVIALGALLYWYIKDREKRLQKWERLEKEKIKSQFETLRNQVNPHFLFNSFNTLVSEIEDDPKRAVEYVEHMADFFRSIVTYREKDIITLGEEINIIKDYLFIQRKRYGDAFIVNIDISAAEENEYYIAPLTLQLLAENAIKHNAILKEKPLLLEIFLEQEQLVVRNNINPKLHPEKSGGLGLQNIQKRYELLTKKTVMISNDDEFFTVIIPVIKKANGTHTDNRR
jgi:ligand-binding sensor domain-containing protein